MAFTIAGRDVEGYLTKATKKVVRTFKGEIERNMLGHVVKFPVVFITLGFDFVLTGLRSELKIIQQLLLGQDTLEVVIDGAYENDYKGVFSATDVTMEDLADKTESMAQLTFSIVSVDGAITNHSGTKFAVKVYPAGTTVAVSGYFGEEVTIPTAYAAYNVVNNVTGASGGKLSTKIVLLGDIWIKS